MNIGPSTEFTSALNDFHSVVESSTSTFYTNATASDPPPPSVSLWFGYDGASINQAESTMFFSINGEDLADIVSQSYLTMTINSDALSGTLIKNTGYSGTPDHVSDHLLSYDESVLFDPGTYYIRFQSDLNVPLRMYLFRTEGTGAQRCLLTQLVLQENLSVLLTAGSYSRIKLMSGAWLSFQCPRTADIPGKVGPEINSLEFISDFSNVDYLYIVHVPTLTSVITSQIAVGRSI